jgi:hypothetical protein
LLIAGFTWSDGCVAGGDCGCSGCSPAEKAMAGLRRNAMNRATRTRVIMKALYVRSRGRTM